MQQWDFDVVRMILCYLPSAKPIKHRNRFANNAEYFVLILMVDSTSYRTMPVNICTVRTHVTQLVSVQKYKDIAIGTLYCVWINL